MKQEKKQFRKETLARRLALSPEEHRDTNALLCGYLGTWLQQNSYSQILYFLPFRNEPDLVETVSGLTHCTAGLPVINEADHSMDFRSWKPGQPLVKNRYKIPEPVEAPVLTPDKNTAILVPTLAMDRRGYRMGYGGGYYDRFLEKAGAATSAGILFHSFVCEQIPTEDHDRKLNFIITDEGVIKI